jgi:hypothetical protein
VDLREAMRSPDLALEPPAALATSVRRQARALRRRRQLGAAALALAVVGGAAAVAPALLPEDDTTTFAVPPAETYGVPDATSDVVLLERVNGAALVAYFQGSDACVSAVRVTRPRECKGPVRASTTAAFPTVFNVVAVDDRRFLVGTTTLRGGEELLLDVTEGEPLVVTASSGLGFVVPFFHVELPRGAEPVRLRAVDRAGAEVARRDL